MYTLVEQILIHYQMHHKHKHQGLQTIKISLVLNVKVVVPDNELVSEITF